MNLEYFSAMPFIQSISDNARWTVSTKTKMPIDMNRLIRTGEIVGAKFDNGNEPLITLTQLISALPNAANAAYKLNQSVDEFVVLDIEPKCPADIRDKLLTLPYKYCELSMSGSGFHLVFDKPNTQYQDILYGKPAVKEKHGWYEILLNHYVTFRGKVCQPSSTSPNSAPLLVPHSPRLLPFNLRSTIVFCTAAARYKSVPEPI